MKIKELTRLQKIDLAKLRINNDPEWKYSYEGIDYEVKVENKYKSPYPGFYVTVTCYKYADQPIFITIGRFYLDEIEYLIDNDLLYKEDG